MLIDNIIMFVIAIMILKAFIISMIDKIRQSVSSLQVAYILFADFLFGPKKHILASASVFLLSHHISNICILGEMLRVPMVTLNYEPKLFCSYMFSMRPDPSIMNPALVAMVRELRPRVVSVIVEGKRCTPNPSFS